MGRRQLARARAAQKPPRSHESRDGNAGQQGGAFRGHADRRAVLGVSSLEPSGPGERERHMGVGRRDLDEGRAADQSSRAHEPRDGDAGEQGRAVRGRGSERRAGGGGGAGRGPRRRARPARAGGRRGGGGGGGGGRGGGGGGYS